jgi:hypothetical protein
LYPVGTTSPEDLYNVLPSCMQSIRGPAPSLRFQQSSCTQPVPRRTARGAEGETFRHRRLVVHGEVALLREFREGCIDDEVALIERDDLVDLARHRRHAQCRGQSRDA